jgi:hypothetical protein
MAGWLDGRVARWQDGRVARWQRVAGWQVDSGWVAKIHFHDGMMARWPIMAHLPIVSHRRVGYKPSNHPLSELEILPLVLNFILELISYLN